MQSHCCVFALKVPQDLFDHHRLFNAGGDLNVAAAVLAGLDVDIEYALQALRPGHRCSAFDRCWAVRRMCRTGLVALTALGRRHLCAMRAVGGKHAVESSQINPRLRHQRDESGDEVLRASCPPPFGPACGGSTSLQAMLSIGSKMTCVVPSRYGVLSS